MRIDYDLLRDILKLISECEDIDGVSTGGIQCSGDLPRQVMLWHVKVLFDNGFIDGLDASSKDGIEFINMQLTLEGQKFYDNIKSNKIWNAIKEKATAIGTELSVEFIKQAAPIVLRSLLNPQ